MHCINCGNKLGMEGKFCTNCGNKVVSQSDPGLAVKKIFWHWKTFFLTIIIASFFWFLYYYGFVDRSSESTNIMVHLLETVGRQRQAWGKSEQITELMSTGLSDECLYTEGCIDEVISRITTLRAEIDKESAEIDNLWSENVIGNDFDAYFSTLNQSDQTRLMDVLNIYFPEESKELNISTQLL